MRALSTYGLDNFGIDTTTEINNLFTKAIKDTFSDQEAGAIAFKDIVAELYQKAEAIQDGRSKGFRMFTAECVNKRQRDALMRKTFEILQSAGWDYNLKLTDDSLLPA